MRSLSSSTSDISEQLETCNDQMRLAWTRGWRAGKSVNLDRTDPNTTDLWNSPKLQHSHSCTNHNNASSIENSPDWLEDNWSFSRQSEVPVRKKSLWDWRRLRALAHIGQQSFSCMFSLRVHSIERLPQSMNGSFVSVCWRKGNRVVQTKPATVSQGIVKFEETLHQTSTIYGSKKPDQGMYYRSKFFTLFATALDAEGLDFGKYRLDLSKMLPEFLGDCRENAEPRTWSTSFKLAGKAVGGTLAVTLRYRILNKDIWQTQPINTGYVDSPDRLSQLSKAPPMCALEGHASFSIFEPGETSNYLTDLSLKDPVNENPSKSSLQLQQSKDMKRSSLASLFALEAKGSLFPPANHLVQCSGISNGTVCSLFPPANHLVQCSGISNEIVYENEDEVIGLDDDIEFTVIEKGVEITCGNLSELLDCNKSCGEIGLKSREEEGSNVKGITLSQLQQSDFLCPLSEKNVDVQESQVSHEHKQERHSDLGKTSTLNDDDLVESEFLSMLNQDHDLFCSDPVSESESNLARLCHQFDKESFSEASSLGTELYVPTVSSFTQASRHNCASDDLNLVSLVQAAGSELEKETAQTMCSLDDAGVQALIKKWGLEEKFSQNSPPDPSGGFGSPINSHVPEPANGLGMDDEGLPRPVSSVRLIMHESKP